jgi:hypothetical protein
MHSQPEKTKAPATGTRKGFQGEVSPTAKEGTIVSNSTALTIGTTSVRQVGELYSLNDLHRASGDNPNQRPGEFIRNQQTQELIAELLNAGISAFESRRGGSGGTYACKELVIAYAAWISAAFHLKVIRVFLAQMAPAATPRSLEIDYSRISPAQAQDLKLIVQAIVDAGIQNYAETWARLQRKFKVNSYLALPAERHEEARAYLIAKLPNGYALGTEEELPPSGISPFDGQAMRAARKTALDFMAGIRLAAKEGRDIPPMESLPADVLTGILADALLRQRFLAFFNADGTLQLKPMADNAVVLDLERGDLGTIAQAVPMARLAELMEALSRRTQAHLDAFGNYLTRSGGLQLA